MTDTTSPHAGKTEYAIEVRRTSEYWRWVQVTRDDVDCNDHPGVAQWQSALRQDWAEYIDRSDLWEPLDPFICELDLDAYLADVEAHLADYDREPGEES